MDPRADVGSTIATAKLRFLPSPEKGRRDPISVSSGFTKTALCNDRLPSAFIREGVESIALLGIDFVGHLKGSVGID